MKKNLPTQFNKNRTNLNSILTKTIRSKISNHKEFIKALDTKDILDNTNNFQMQLHNMTIYRSKPCASTHCPRQIKETALQRS